MQVLVFINSGGPNVVLENVKDTLLSISQNLGTQDYGFCYVTDSAANEIAILKLFKELSLEDKLISFKVNDHSWAYNFNTFFDEYSKNTEYILFSHDDLEVKTKDFFTNAKKQIETSKQKIGWATFTSDGYYSLLGISMTNSVREGYSKDRMLSPQTFECHSFAPGEIFTKEKIDLPSRTVKIHAPLPHLVLISVSSLKEIGYCSDWSKYTLLIDEDWGLRSLVKGYNNIWIPEITYSHPLRSAERKSQGLRYEIEVHKHFYDKWDWNFMYGNYNDAYIEYICDKYPNTNISLTRNINSYDWQYLEAK